MNFSELPADIICMIARMLVPRHGKSYKTWKAGIPLLSICRPWRFVAKPSLYSWAVVECHDSCADEPGTDITDGGGDLAGKKWLSNIGFIGSLGDIRELRALELILETPVDIAAFVHHAMSMATTKLSCLSSVVSLKLQFNADPLEPVATALPRVQRLEIFSSQMSEGGRFVDLFCASLLRIYARQLRVLHNQLHTSMQLPELSGQLESLRLWLPESGPKRLPRINTASIKHLFIDSVPDELPWESFSDPMAPGYISFDSLRSLELRGNCMVFTPEALSPTARAPPAANRPRFLFPRLDTLRLELCSSVYLELLRDWRPTAVKSLHLAGALAHLCQLPLMQLESAHSLSIMVACATEREQEELYALTNHLFGDMKPAHYSALHLCDAPFAIDFSLIRWTNLTYLNYGALIDLADVLSLLPRLPRLQTLELTLLSVGSMCDEIAGGMSTVRQQQTLEPLATQLVKLDVYERFSQHTFAFVATIFTYLALRIRTLRTIETYGRFKDAIHTALQESAATHPHLASIKTKHCKW
ncbi:hypothetical protein IWQ56_001100 [Coemansia nantahalensis]|nr:hypothetical protein IWQ56_001100 [Coemansia nantahalensis]